MNHFIIFLLVIVSISFFYVYKSASFIKKNSNGEVKQKGLVIFQTNRKFTEVTFVIITGSVIALYMIRVLTSISNIGLFAFIFLGVVWLAVMSIPAAVLWVSGNSCYYSYSSLSGRDRTLCILVSFIGIIVGIFLYIYAYKSMSSMVEFLVVVSGPSQIEL